MRASRGGSPEQLFQPVPGDFHPRERDSKVGGGVADHVVDRVVREVDAKLGVSVGLDHEPARSQRCRECPCIVVELEAKVLRALCERRDRAGILQPACVDRDQRVADALDLRGNEGAVIGLTG